MLISVHRNSVVPSKGLYIDSARPVQLHIVLAQWESNQEQQQVQGAKKEKSLYRSEG